MAAALLLAGLVGISLYLSRDTFPSEAVIARGEAEYGQSLDFEADLQKLQED